MKTMRAKVTSVRVTCPVSGQEEQVYLKTVWTTSSSCECCSPEVTIYGTGECGKEHVLDLGGAG